MAENARKWAGRRRNVLCVSPLVFFLSLLCLLSLSLSLGGLVVSCGRLCSRLEEGLQLAAYERRLCGSKGQRSKCETGLSKKKSQPIGEAQQREIDGRYAEETKDRTHTHKGTKMAQ